MTQLLLSSATKRWRRVRLTLACLAVTPYLKHAVDRNHGIHPGFA